MYYLMEPIKFALSKIKRESITLSKEQNAAIVTVCSEKDSIVCLPTGHGKSIIFEVAPWYHACLASEAGSYTSYSVLIVSPLLSLMNKQVEDLKQRGLSAIRLSSDLPAEVEDSVKRAQIMYIFASPEILEERKWRELLLTTEYQICLKAVFIDEAHCVEMWANSRDPFRHSYQKLGDLRSFLPINVPFCALTATASKETRKFVIDSLGLVNVVTISLSPNRNNIMYHVHRMADGDISVTFEWIIHELRKLKLNTPKKVVYCQSIENCAKLYRLFDMTLKEEGYVGPNRKAGSCLFAMYHAKITDDQKSAILASFSNPDGKCRVLFATIAFGMGVNIPNIRMIIHYGPSHNIEEYVQECGRGGRDGLQCHALLHTYSGCTRGRISDNMKDYCRKTDVCRRRCLFQHFPGDFSLPSIPHECCDVCHSQCLCACTCGHCICGKGFPCTSCCQCSKRCNSNFTLPSIISVGLGEVNMSMHSNNDTTSESQLMWDEEHFFYIK